jgi:hypothetical protein
MPTEPPAGPVPPIEPVPVVPPAVPVTPPPPPVPPTVDPYAASTPPPPAYGAAAYAPAYQPGYYGAPQPPRGLAIASLITGIVGVFFSLFYGAGFLPSLAGIITGHIASKRQPHARGMWLAGLICGYIGLGISVLWFIGIVIFIVYFAANASTFDSGDYSQY